MNLRLDEAPADSAAIEAIVARYRADYEREFGYTLPEDMAAIEFVNARAAAIGRSDTPELPASEDTGDAKDALLEERAVYFEELGDFTSTPIYDRSKLRPEAKLEGPAMIEQMDTTVLVPPGASARVDKYVNVVIDAGSDAVPAPSGNGANPGTGA
jgi:N-methylhydantoinase A